MLIYDKPVVSGQPPLSIHLPVPWGWPLNGGFTVCILILCKSDVLQSRFLSFSLPFRNHQNNVFWASGKEKLKFLPHDFKPVRWNVTFGIYKTNGKLVPKSLRKPKSTEHEKECYQIFTSTISWIWCHGGVWNFQPITLI